MLSEWLKNKKRSENISLPQEKTVHGIKIEKVKVRKYLESMQDIQDLPKQIIQKCFPEEGLTGLIRRAKTADTDFISDFISKLLINAPEMIIELAAKYIDATKDELLDLTPTELFDVLEAWWELNDLSTFFKNVWSKVKPILQTTVNTGFKDGSLSQNPSE